MGKKRSIGFHRILKVAFQLFLAPARNSSPAGQIF